MSIDLSFILHRTLTDYHEGTVNVLEFSQDGKYLATGCEDGTVRIFGTSSGSLRSTYEKEVTAIDAIVWNRRELGHKSPCIYVGTRAGHVYQFSKPDWKASAYRMMPIP